MTDWIKTSDRLPEKQGRYLTLVITYLDDQMEPYIMIREYLPKYKNFVGNVSHWMPLAELPTELPKMPPDGNVADDI